MCRVLRGKLSRTELPRRSSRRRGAGTGAEKFVRWFARSAGEVVTRVVSCGNCWPLAVTAAVTGSRRVSDARETTSCWCNGEQSVSGSVPKARVIYTTTTTECSRTRTPRSRSSQGGATSFRADGRRREKKKKRETKKKEVTSKANAKGYEREPR